MCALSLLEQERLRYLPIQPATLDELSKISIEPMIIVRDKKLHSSEIDELFPNTRDLKPVKFIRDKVSTSLPSRVGVVFSGGQAAGGHNVISGLFDALKSLNSRSQLFGFLNGPSGITENKSIEITEDLLSKYRNLGGFTLIGSGRTKIETKGQFESAEATVRALNLDGLVIIGGDDSNTNAALLTEYFISKKCKTAVVGVPKTIDGDLKNDDVEISFGFDTATKTYSDIIGNIMRDAISAKKYYYFIKLMGRSASHITLECALKTHPNIALIGEEVQKKNNTFSELINEISDTICLRAKKGKDYGVILIPEGIVEFIPEFKSLIDELNSLVSTSDSSDIEAISKQLSSRSQSCFNSMPKMIQSQLLIGRDPHGNVQVSKIETERLFIEAVTLELQRRKQEGSYLGKFGAQPIFCGYEGRSCLPSNFDCNYCYSLGKIAALLIDKKLTGYMCAIKYLAHPIDKWELYGIPIVSMMDFETRHSKQKPVVTKTLVDLQAPPFLNFAKQRKSWATQDDYTAPGPIQFFGPPELTNNISMTLVLEKK